MKQEFFKHAGERKIICDDPPAEIKLSDQLFDVPPSVSENSLRRARNFCQKRENAPLYEQPDESHRKAVRALEAVASEIYASRFLLPEESSQFPIEAFTEVALGRRRGQERVDLVLVGPGGAGLLEVKPAGISAGPQLKRYQDTWEKRFPDVPCFAIKATYWEKGQKFKIALYDKES